MSAVSIKHNLNVCQTNIEAIRMLDAKEGESWNELFDLVREFEGCTSFEKSLLNFLGRVVHYRIYLEDLHSPAPKNKK
jgi:hypothetical protein